MTEPSDVPEQPTAADWNRPVPHWSKDPFAGRTTVHGLRSDEVRSALHKYVRQGNVEQSIRCALELARTDPDHDAEMWRRLQVLAAEDIGMGTPEAITVVRALHESANDTDDGSYDRLVFATHAAGYLARSLKDPVNGEMMQVALHADAAPEIPDDARCVHTRAGQELGRTMYDWFVTGTAISPEAPDRDLSAHDLLPDLYFRIDPPVTTDNG